ncbi:DegT/DnrJ/EryC1/StrS family aminotransferase [Helicobacter suis]|uniref:DegT/DnrJ/EryC1/StrS family aminotransferase n=1 Tax=Helicobacter suis TaxID=104628 RepID=UPI001F077D45|nr:DegT/DnrJ/EryC1/StrS family aminotransferase [Helicobacter suis]
MGVKHVCVCTSATSALFMIYQALNFKDQTILTTPLSFVATSSMLLANTRRRVSHLPAIALSSNNSVMLEFSGL